MIVCDTNVVISALLIPGSIPDKIIQRVLAGRVRHATSPEILQELQRVLRRKFPSLAAHVTSYLALLTESSHVVQPTTRLHAITTDPTDNRILECAVAAQAQFIISGDHKHILPLHTFQGIQIVSPREFLAFMK